MGWNVLAPGTLNGLTVATRDTIIGNPPSRFYMTGDGHRNPPFNWATRETVSGHFQQEMANKNLCLHVEQHQEAVTAASIPYMFNDVFVAQKVFGWELSTFRALMPVMTLINEIRVSLPNPSFGDVRALANDMFRMSLLASNVGSPAWMTGAPAQSDAFLAYWKTVLRAAPAPRVAATEEAYAAFIKAYHHSAMLLRTDANNFIAVNIARVIALHPNATHLITMGDAHLTVNPVQNYLNIGENKGIVDASQN